MTKDVWLPKGYVLPSGAKVCSLLYSGESWQIFTTSNLSNILLARPQLVEKWEMLGFLDRTAFESISFGKDFFWSMASSKEHTLEPVMSGKPPKSTTDALAFSLALKESRLLSSKVSFLDALYIEKYARLLPTWTLTPVVDDALVLGIWLTGGVEIPATSFRRLTQLTGWMPVGELSRIVQAAGLSLPLDAELLDRNRSISRISNKEKKYSLKEPTGDKVFKLSGRSQLEVFFNEHIIDIIYNSERYHALGIDFPSAVVLHGPPGCGKTFAVERLVEFLDWPVYSINSNTVGSPYIHSTSTKISEVFDQAIENAPSILIIDEMESFLANRELGSSSSLHHIEEVAEFLRRIPEAIKKRVLIIAMTNLLDLIDPAMLRRGRFDHIIQVGMPSGEEVTSLVNSLLSQLPKVEPLDIKFLVDELSGKSLSDIAFVIRESARITVKSGKTQIDEESLKRALHSLPRETLVKNNNTIGFVKTISE